MTLSDAAFAGGARFQSNQAIKEGNKPAEGGAIRTSLNSSLSFNAASWFTSNKATAGAAIKLGDPLNPDPACKWTYSDQLRFNPGSSSCWIGNSAQQAASGAGLHIDGNSNADFSLIQQHNFGPNRAGPPAQQWESDIWVAQGSFTCGSGRVRETGRYAITGNVCAVGCTGKSCACSACEVFSPSKCSCQRR